MFINLKQKKSMKKVYTCWYYFLLAHSRTMVPVFSACMCSVLLFYYFLGQCPGFGQDRVNFHQNPGRGTARWADPTWPNRAGYSIPCAVMLGSSGGELGSGNSLAARERAAAVVESGSLCCAVCFVFSPYLYHCCYCSLCLLFC